MSDSLNKDLFEWASWHEEHKKDSRDIEQRVRFLEKMVEGFLTLHTGTAEDIQALEGRPPESLGRKLYVPSGINVSGNVRRFG